MTSRPHDRRDDCLAIINLATTDLDGTFARLEAADAEVIHEPTDQPYGSATAPFATLRATSSASRS